MSGVYPDTLPLGAGCGSAFANATDLVLGAVARERAGSAAAINETTYEFAGVLGIAVLGAVLGSSVDPDGVTAGAARALWVAALSIGIAVAFAASIARAKTAAVGV